jgi:hypothetical protein
MLARTLGFLAVVVASAVTAIPVGAHPDSAAAAAHWAHTFTDPAGDGGTAPDLTALEVGSDDAGQAIFHVSAAISPTDKTSILSVFIDSDHNKATGDQNFDGADYEFDAYQETDTYTFSRWNSSTAQWEAAPDTTVHVTIVSDGITFSVNRSELGNAGQVSVEAESITAFDHYGTGEYDWTPNQKSYEYDLSPLQLTAAAYKGQWYAHQEVLALAVSRSDTHDFVSGSDGTLTCVARVAGHTFKPTQTGFLTIKDVPVATCGWAFPKTLKGKKGTATVSVAFAGRTVTRTASFKVQ